jgi:predicted DNA-binding WGR domain protein
MERSELDGAIVHWHFTCVESANNHNKFWSIWLLQNGDLYVEYGRIGNAAQSKHHSIGNGTIAFRKMDSLIRQKQAKGYRQTESPQQTTPEAVQPTQRQTDARSIALSWD